MSNIIFADDKRSGRILVDPVNDARPEDTVDPGQTVSAVIEQSIYQSVLIMPRGGMNDHILRLIDDEETIIFIDNANSDTNQYAKMIASVGGRIDMNYFPGMPARVEIRFTPLRNKNI